MAPSRSHRRQLMRRWQPLWLFATAWVLLQGIIGCSSLQDSVFGPVMSGTNSTGVAEEQGVANTRQLDGKDEQDKTPVGPKEDKQPDTPDNDAVAPRTVIPVAGPPLSMDLHKAIGLADVGNPTIALAQETVQASLAARTHARSLLLPTLDVGMNFNSHEGTLESGRGIIRDVNRQALYVGAGAAAVGGGTVGFPGVRLTAHLGDAIYEPRATEQLVTGRRFDAQATSNNVLLEVAEQYYALAGAEARRTAIHQSQADLQKIVELTANFARKGQGREGDAGRARGEALLLNAQEQRAQEDVAVASAELVRLLTMDPSVQLKAPTDTLSIVQLVDPDESLESLINIATSNRPEIGARSADVAVVETRLRRERVRPFLPFIFVGYSAGRFGGGSDQADNRFGNFAGRTDFDVMAVWSLQNMGFGNLAVRRRLRAQVGETEADLTRVLNEIRREVAEAYAQSAASLRELEIARRRVETSQRSFSLDLARTKNLQGHPIEVLNSLNQLAAARLALIQATVDYNQAQLRLFVSLGRSPTALLGHGD